MGNCLGKNTFSAPTFASSQPQAETAPIPPAQPFALNELPPELKAAVTRYRDSASSKALRLINHGFRQAGAERFTTLEIPVNLF